MRKLVFCLIIMLSVFSVNSQTTYFDDSSAYNDGNVRARLYSIELQEKAVIATIELTAIKPQRRLNYWCSFNCYIEYKNIRLLECEGYYINGRVEECRYENKWGWDKVGAGEKRYYQLYFEGSLPSGLTNFSIIDGGQAEWINRQHYLRSSYSFKNITINNPRKNYTDVTSEYSAKQKIDMYNDGICGIYEQIGGETNYKFACMKQMGEYVLVYLSSSLDYDWWKVGDIKAYLHKSASGIFKVDWFMADKSINKDCYVTFDGVSMTVNLASGTDPGETKYLKMYPTTPPSYNDYQQERTPQRQQQSPQRKQIPILKKQNIKK